MAAAVDVNISCDDTGIPDTATIRSWVEAALSMASPGESGNFEVAVNVVGPEEMRSLNYQFRGQDKTTNVLSFPAGDIAGLPAEAPRMLGDIVICAAVVSSEAREQGKATAAHWGHMLVHGTLHLLGYDHQAETDAVEMENLETAILATGNVSDPYRVC